MAWIQKKFKRNAKEETRYKELEKIREKSGGKIYTGVESWDELGADLSRLLKTVKFDVREQGQVKEASALNNPFKVS